jgi:hypothetical protein
MGSNRDCAFAKPQVSDVSKSLQASEIMFEFRASEQCPRQDSNLRSRLRRGLLCARLTCGNVPAKILAGRISGAELGLERDDARAQ